MSASMAPLEPYGPVVALRQGRRVLGLLPPLLEVRCYAVDGLLIDSGLHCFRRQVLAFCRAQGIGQAVLTHHHEDHSGNAAALIAQDVPVRASDATRQRVARGFAIEPYQHVMWGQAPRAQAQPLPAWVETARHRFQVLPAPGHCDDQIVLFEPQQGWLFTGDAFLGEFVKNFRRDEDFALMVASLRRLCALSFDALFCAHKPVPTGGHAALQRKLDLLLDIEGQVRALHARGLPLRRIAEQVLGPERRFLYAITLGDVSKYNLVRAILHGPRPRRR